MGPEQLQQLVGGLADLHAAHMSGSKGGSYGQQEVRSELHQRGMVRAALQPHAGGRRRSAPGSRAAAHHPLPNELMASWAGLVVDVSRVATHLVGAHKGKNAPDLAWTAAITHSITRLLSAGVSGGGTVGGMGGSAESAGGSAGGKGGGGAGKVSGLRVASGLLSAQDAGHAVAGLMLAVDQQLQRTTGCR